MRGPRIFPTVVDLDPTQYVPKALKWHAGCCNWWDGYQTVTDARVGLAEHLRTEHGVTKDPLTLAACDADWCPGCAGEPGVKCRTCDNTGWVIYEPESSRG